MKISNKLVLRGLLCLTLLSAVSCGDDGGDGINFAGASELSIRANPGTVDTGDRILITVNLSNIHSDGIALKVKFPTELSYVPDSALIEQDGEMEDLSPSVLANDDDDNTFLVFYINEDDFGNEKQGKLTFELLGKESITKGNVEVDSDVDDPEINNSNEFDVNNPEFDAEDSVEVSVEG